MSVHGSVDAETSVGVAEFVSPGLNPQLRATRNCLLTQFSRRRAARSAPTRRAFQRRAEGRGHLPTRSWDKDPLLQPECRDVLHKLLDQDWTDAIRARHPDEVIYTFWDYMRGAFSRNAGLRIDHLLLSPELAPRRKAAGVDKDVRAMEKTSDHAPTWIELAS
jgi:hypothetical protein